MAELRACEFFKNSLESTPPLEKNPSALWPWSLKTPFVCETWSLEKISEVFVEVIGPAYKAGFPFSGAGQLSGGPKSIATHSFSKRSVKIPFYHSN
jgi:hypothetical protein